jgi:hypothetical protein
LQSNINHSYDKKIIDFQENLDKLKKILEQYQNYVVDNTPVETIEEEITPEILTEEPLVDEVKTDEPKYRSLIYVKPTSKN